MVTATLTRSYSVEEAKAIEDAEAFELVDGELEERAMGTKASWVEAKVISLLIGYSESSKLVWILASSVALHLFPERPKDYRRADASAVLRSRFDGDEPPDGDLYFAPDLVVEVLSPGDNAYRVDSKIEDYLAVGVRLLWVVYPATRTVMVYRPGHSPLRLGLDDEVSGFDVLPGFSCHVRDFFPS